MQHARMLQASNRSVPLPLQVEECPRTSLRIAVVTETYPPEVNGVAATIASFVEGLRARNHEVQLIRPRQEKGERADTNGRFQQVLMRGLPIPNYPHLKMGLPSKRALVDLWKLRRPDLVHIVTEGPLGWSSIQAAAKLKIPMCSDFRTNFHSYSKHYGIGWLQRPITGYLRKFHNRTRLTMVPTEALKLQLSADGFRNLRVIARGVDTRLFHPQRRSEALRASWGADPSTTVVVHVGRLAPEKNLGTLVSAYEAMRAVDPTLKFVFVGDGPARQDLQNQFPDAVFAGMRSGLELATHYASGDVFLFPSVTETFGNVTPEAMASGLAVLAYDYAAAAQLIQPQASGLLAPFDDAQTFVRMAVELVSDRDALRSMGQRARGVVEDHAWDRVVEQLEAVYYDVATSGATEDVSQRDIAQCALPTPVEL